MKGIFMICHLFLLCKPPPKMLIKMCSSYEILNCLLKGHSYLTENTITCTALRECASVLAHVI